MNDRHLFRSPAPRLSRRQCLILALLAAGGEMAGLDLVAASPSVGRGSVYVALRRLADKGLVDSRPVNGHRGELPQRLFRATVAARPLLDRRPGWVSREAPAC